MPSFQLIHLPNKYFMAQAEAVPQPLTNKLALIAMKSTWCPHAGGEGEWLLFFVSLGCEIINFKTQSNSMIEGYHQWRFHLRVYLRYLLWLLNAVFLH